MNNILIATDFSEPSINAATYAVQLAKHTGAKVTFIYVYPMPVVATDMPVVLTSYDELDNDSMATLKKTADEISAKCNYTPATDCLVSPGFLLESLTDVVREKNFDLIVMGITGAGALSERLIGSSATVVIRHLRCSTLVIPLSARFQPIHTIVFATDFEKIEHSSAIAQIKNLCTSFQSKLKIVNVIAPHQLLNYDKTVSGMLLDKIFDTIPHSIHLPEGDVVDGINKVIDEQNADLLIMIPRKHALFADILSERHTKKMAFHTHIPLLTIHEE